MTSPAHKAPPPSAPRPWGYVKAEVRSLAQGSSFALPAKAQRFVIVSGRVRLLGPDGHSRSAEVCGGSSDSACIELPSGGGFSLIALSAVQLVLYSRG